MSQKDSLPIEPIPKLFQPTQIGNIQLAHRVVLAPLARFRCDKDNVQTDLGVTYYEQRGTVPGTLLITEACKIAPIAGGGPYLAAIYTPTNRLLAGRSTNNLQVVDAVHAKGSYIYCQLWAGGRAAPVGESVHGEDVFFYAPSAIPLPDRENYPIHELSVEEIKQFVELFVKAAVVAVERAGFDGIELHGANGYLIDQFIQDVSNHRTDEYGGSIENRARFALELVEAVSKAIGIKRTAIRFGPWTTVNGMGMEDRIPTFSYLVKRLVEGYPDLAYLHLIEPGVNNFQNFEPGHLDSNDFIREMWLPRPLITAGRYYRKEAIERSEKTGELIAFGRLFISNPDLPLRLKKNLRLNKWDHDYYYVPGEPHGYIDYPFADEDTPVAEDDTLVTVF